MNREELEEKKKELMQPDWTENLHYALEELQLEDAKEIVESMTDIEICQKVNCRKHQEDYIADYLEYLWDISKVAYWKHVKSTLTVEYGILLSDNMSHFEKLCKYEIPDDVWKTVLNFAIDCDERNKQDLDAISCVIKAQVEKFGKLEEIKKYISQLDKNKQDIANKRINNMLEYECNYQFFD
jgi:hypothetical protein